MLVAGSARCLPERRAELLRRIRVMEAASSQDAGCLYYRFSHDLVDPHLFESVEIWASEADLQAHLSRGHTVDFIAAMETLIVGSPALTIRPL